MSHQKDRRPLRLRLSARAVNVVVGVLLLLCSLAFPMAADAAIAYVQGAYTTPAASNVASVAYTSAQSAGNLNVVVVDWG